MKLADVDSWMGMVRYLAEVLHRRENEDDECPGELVPSEADLCQADFRTDAGDAAASKLLRKVIVEGGADDTSGGDWQWGAVERNAGDGVGLVSWTRNPTKSVRTPDSVHAAWKAMPNPRPLHPLGPLVRDWRAWKAEQPKHTTPFVPKSKASWPRLRRIGKEAALLPKLREPPRQGELLPVLGHGEGFPFWIVSLFQHVGGQTTERGMGAAWALKLFCGALLHLRISERDGNWHTFDVPAWRTIDDVPPIADWLHPYGWENKRRDWKNLPTALHLIRNGLNAVLVPGVGSVQIISVPVIPASRDDPFVRFSIMLPPTAARGVNIDWHRLRHYGTISTPLYCAYLAAMEAIDLSARKGVGITRTIGRPMLDASGKPLRGKGGAVKRNRAEQEANPAARYVRAYSKTDLARMAGLDPARNRVYLHRAITAFEELDDDNMIELARDGANYRIFAPSRQTSWLAQTPTRRPPRPGNRIVKKQKPAQVATRACHGVTESVSWRNGERVTA